MPPVTAERSPPLSRMTGADSPVMADSSTVAMPSTTSPSPGITSPATTTHRSPSCSAVEGFSTREPSGWRTLAMVSARVLRSVAACALPRPSAIASAKLANSTVNHSQSDTSPAKTFSLAVDEPRSRKNRTVVSTEPTSTTNMTGLRIMVRGLSLTKLSLIACCVMAGSNSFRAAGGRRRDLTGRGAAGSRGSVSVEVMPVLLEAEVLDDGAEREHGEEGQAGDDQDHAEHESRRTAGCRSGTCRR